MKRITESCLNLVDNVKLVLESFDKPELRQYAEKIAALDDAPLLDAVRRHYFEDMGFGFHQAAALDSGDQEILYTNESTVNDIAPFLERCLSTLEEIHENRELMEREPHLEAFLNFSILNIGRQLSERPDSMDWMHDNAWMRALCMYQDLVKVPTAEEARADRSGIAGDYFAYLRAVNGYYEKLGAGIEGTELNESRNELIAAADKLAEVPPRNLSAWFNSGYGRPGARNRTTDNDSSFYSREHGMANVGEQLDAMGNAMEHGFTAEEAYCLRSFAAAVEPALRGMVGIPFSDRAMSLLQDSGLLAQRARAALETGFENEEEKKRFFEEYYEELTSIADRMDDLDSHMTRDDWLLSRTRERTDRMLDLRDFILSDSGPAARMRAYRDEQFLKGLTESETAEPEKDSFVHRKFLEFMEDMEWQELDSVLRRALSPERYQEYAENRDRQIDNIVRLENGRVTREDVMNAKKRWLPGIAGSIFSDTETVGRVYRETLFSLPRSKANGLVTAVQAYVPAARRAEETGEPAREEEDPLFSLHAYDMTPEQKAAFRQRAGQLANGRTLAEVQALRNKLDLLDEMEKPRERTWNADTLMEEPGLRQEVRDRILQLGRDRALTEQVCSEMANELGFSNARECFACDDRDFYVMIEYPPELTTEERKKAFAREWLDRYMDIPEGRKQCLDEYYDRLDRRDQKMPDLRCLSKDGDPTPIQPDGLTLSEHDLIESILNGLNMQARDTKRKENPDYFNSRYRTERGRMLFRAGSERERSFSNSYYCDILGANGFNPSTWQEFSGVVLPPNGPASLEQAHEFYDRRRSAILGKEYAADISVRFFSGYVLSPEERNNNLKRVNTVLQRTSEGQPITARDKALMTELFSYNLFAINDIESQRQQEQFDIDELDLLFVDGVPLKEFVGTKYGDYEKDAGNKESIKGFMRAEFLAAAMSGKHRTEIAEIHVGPDDSYQLSVAEFKVDSHILDETEKHEEHNAVRRLFDIAATKIETRADRQDELWRNDPEKEKRQEGIKARLGEKILKNVYAEKLVREYGTFVAKKAAEAAVKRKAEADDPADHAEAPGPAAAEEPEAPAAAKAAEEPEAPEAAAAAPSGAEIKRIPVTRGELETADKREHPEKISESRKAAVSVKTEPKTPEQKPAEQKSAEQKPAESKSAGHTKKV